MVIFHFQISFKSSCNSKKKKKKGCRLVVLLNYSNSQSDNNKITNISTQNGKKISDRATFNINNEINLLEQTKTGTRHRWKASNNYYQV